MIMINRGFTREYSRVIYGYPKRVMCNTQNALTHISYMFMEMKTEFNTMQSTLGVRHHHSLIMSKFFVIKTVFPTK